MKEENKPASKPSAPLKSIHDEVYSSLLKAYENMPIPTRDSEYGKLLIAARQAFANSRFPLPPKE